MSPDQRQQIETEIEAERRALKRAESVLEGKKYEAPPAAPQPKRATAQASISAKEWDEIFAKPQSSTGTIDEAKMFANHLLETSGLPQDEMEESIGRVEAAAKPSGEHATPQDAMRAMRDVLEDIKAGKLGEHAATSKQDSDRLLSAIEKLTATMERLAAGSGVPRAQASQLSGILPPVLPLIPPLSGVGE
jgi:hypothetical protein